MAARKSGIASVEVIEPNARGNAVQRTTRMKMSQTWFASQTGAIERLMRARSSMSLAGGQVPDAGAEVGAAQHHVGA